MEDLSHLAAYCPRYRHAIELLGRRWTGGIVRALLTGRSRFTEITEAIPGLSDRLLSERLKELEAEGIVVRDVVPETPVRIEYRLTPKGQGLGKAVTALSEWADEWIEPPDPEWARKQAEAAKAEVDARAAKAAGDAKAARGAAPASKDGRSRR